ncbi:MAG: sensor histidine kinase [Solirubrobacteraceae bacterium]
MTRALALPEFLHRRGVPFATWMVLSAALMVGGGLEAVFTDGLDRRLAVPVALIMGAAVALAWRLPVWAAALQLAVTLGQIPFDAPLFDLSIPIYTMAAVIGMGAAREGGRTFVLIVMLGAGTIAGVLAPKTTDPIGDPLFAALFLVGLPTLAGRTFRSRSSLNTELRDRALKLESDRHTRAEEAAAHERRRIAGELHDLVAHGVSGMVVQAGAARRLVKAGDPRASDAIRAVEDGGREALDELRRLLGVLRHDDHDLALAPQPSLSRVGALVAQMREAGMDVQLRVEGEHVAIGPGADVAAYRVVEEALRSAQRAGGGTPLTVVVRWSPRHVDLCVEGVAPSGPELVALNERLRLFGGELRPARRGAPPALRAFLPLDGVTA